MADDPQIAQIKAQFARDGYELIVHPVEHGGYFAPYMRAESQGGVAPFTWGKTALEAAEKAWAEYRASKA